MHDILIFLAGLFFAGLLRRDLHRLRRYCHRKLQELESVNYFSVLPSQGMPMTATVGTPFNVSVQHELDAAGNPVDLVAFPTALVNVVWSVDQSAIATLTPSTDGLSCDVTFLVPGTVVVSASATNAAGATVAGVPLTLVGEPAVPVVASFSVLPTPAPVAPASA